MNNTISSMVARGTSVGLLIALGLFAPGCGSDTTGTAGGAGGSGGGGEIAMTAVGAALVSAMCEASERCGAGGFMPFEFSSKAACESVLSGNASFDIDEIAAVNAGKMTYHSAKASECVALMKSTACGELDMEADNACSQVFSGALEDGAECIKSDVCKSGWCAETDKPAQGCAGKCAPQKKIGEACESGDEDECAATARCAKNKCAAGTPGKVGESCEYGPCETGLRCAYDAKGALCQKRAIIGEACKNGRECAIGLRCATGKCAAPGKAYADCSVQDAFQGSTECEKGMNCTMELENGAPKSQMCKTKIAAGGACKVINECAGIDLYCSAGKCITLPKIGEACAAPTEAPFIQCVIGAKCKAAKCVADRQAKEGETCKGPSCESGLTCNDKFVCEKGAAPVCTKK